MSVHPCDCTQASVQAAFDAATEDGAIVRMTGTCPGGQSWTTPANWNAPSNSIFWGPGVSQAVIQDNYNNGAALIVVNTPTTGTFRFHGIKLIPGGNQDKTDGVLSFGGQCKHFRMDNVDIDSQQDTAHIHNNVQITGHINGVIHDCNIKLHSTGNGVRVFYGGYGGGATDDGARSWAADTSFGSSDFVFLEDNVFEGNSRFSCINDSSKGGKTVFRFNDINKSWIQTHPTRSGTDRGGRATEIYFNKFISASGAGSLSSPHSEAFFHDSGPSLLFGNTAPEWYQSFHNAHSARRTWDGNSQHREGKTPEGWGWAGPSPQSGTVTVDGTGLVVTKTAGTDFDVTWPAGSMIWIGTTTVDARRISSVDSTTQITLIDAATPGSGQAYSVGSNWDGNQDDYGYPNLDQPGRGKGDLITGDFPNKINVDNGNADASSPDAWPRQALEPLRDWLNTWVAVPDNPGTLFNGQAGTLVQNRDYYLQDDANCPDSGANCTAGVGHGNTKPTNCTNGTGFWKENEGSWRTQIPTRGVLYTGQGILYTCVASAWASYYTPYPYPHPERLNADPDFGEGGSSNAVLMGQIVT